MKTHVRVQRTIERGDRLPRSCSRTSSNLPRDPVESLSRGVKTTRPPRSRSPLRSCGKG